MGLQPSTPGNRVSYKRKQIQMIPSEVVEARDHAGPRRLEINVRSTYPYMYIY